MEVSRCTDESNHPYDYLAKIVLCGREGVGKWSLMLRFTQNEFCLGYKPAIGVDRWSLMMKVGPKIIKAHCWEAPGQVRSHTMSQLYYRGAIGALLVYDITRRWSFEYATTRGLQEIRDNADPNVVILLVGNKSDLHSSRAVSTEEGLAFAEQNGISFVETSARDSTNVDLVFHNLLREICKVMESNESKNTPTPTQKSGNCCVS